MKIGHTECRPCAFCMRKAQIFQGFLNQTRSIWAYLGLLNGVNWCQEKAASSRNVGRQAEQFYRIFQPAAGALSFRASLPGPSEPTRQEARIGGEPAAGTFAAGDTAGEEVYSFTNLPSHRTCNLFWCSG